MKKQIASFALAAFLLSAAPCASAQEAAPAGQQPEVTVVIEGEKTILTDAKGQEYVLTNEEYQAEIERGLTPSKIINNKHISEADSSGVGVTIMAMCIVLGALIVLSVLFMCFGKIFGRSLARKKREAHGIHPDDENHDDTLASGETIAAIALALDEHFSGKHDMEDTVLTIRRMQRAYSPWNSKIYHLRETPQLRKRK